MKVFKNGRKQFVNDGDIYCLILNYNKKGTICYMHIHGQTSNGLYKLNSGFEYLREATLEEENKYIELTKKFKCILKRDSILSEWNNLIKK
jgi:hypothetical protein